MYVFSVLLLLITSLWARQFVYVGGGRGMKETSTAKHSKCRPSSMQSTHKKKKSRVGVLLADERWRL